MNTNGFDVQMNSVLAGSSGTGHFSSVIGYSSHSSYELKEVYGILKKMPSTFTKEDVAKCKGFEKVESANKILKKMRRMQLVKRISPGSALHQIAPFYVNRIP